MAAFAVLGARGGLGRELVKRLAERPEEEVAEIRAVVRDRAAVAADAFPGDPRVKVMEGDCTRPDTLREALSGTAGVFYTASGRSHDEAIAVDQNGVQSVAALAKELGVGRLLLVSAQLVHPTNHRSPVRGMLNTVVTGLWHRHGLMDFKFAGEQLLRRSGQEYCIVRPGRMLDGPLGHTSVHIGQTNGHFMKGAATTRADTAAVCVAAMLAPEAKNTTFELASGEPLAASESAPAAAVSQSLFKDLQEDWDKAWSEGLAGPWPQHSRGGA